MDLKPAQFQRSGARYVIVHLDVGREARAFWASATGGLESEELKKPPFKFPKEKMYLPTAETLIDLTEQFGVPVYRDEWIAVWDLRS